ncbi:MAG: HAD family hydrolase [Verrucomicrobiota bacterium]|nr:HAD family hydrolase [Verrucomicrobiota bacterium]
MIKHIVTDFDGTLTGAGGAEFPLNTFAVCLSGMKIRYNSVWTIATARTKKGMKIPIARLARLNLLPDYIIVRDGYIYKKNFLGYLPIVSWNFSVFTEKRNLLQQIIPTIKKLKIKINENYSQNIDFATKKHQLIYSFSNKETLLKAKKYVSNELSNFPQVKTGIYNNKIYIYYQIYSKGETIKYLNKKLEILAKNVFAIGDSPNDLSMLHPEIAQMTACVGNADEKVKTKIKENKGYLAKKNFSQGIAESLEYFYN